MAKFFDPPQAKPLLPKEKIDSVYKSMRFKVFMGSFLGYAAYYLVRKNLSLASADMIAEGLIDKQGVGIAASAVSIAYAFYLPTKIVQTERRTKQILNFRK